MRRASREADGDPCRAYSTKPRRRDRDKGQETNRREALGRTRRDNVWRGVVKALVWDLRPRVECRNEYRTQFLIKIMDSFED